MLRVECTRCDRKGRYHVHKLLEKYGRKGNMMTFLSISANGAANGIVLNNTGALGGLTVTGSGATDGSGGTIQNITNRGVSAIDAVQINLSNMNFTNTGTVNGADPTDVFGTAGGLQAGTNTGANAGIHLQNVTDAILVNLNLNRGVQCGINGNNVTNFALSDSVVENFGDQINEVGVRFKNLLGTSSMTNVIVRNNHTFQTEIQNNTGSVNLAVTGSEFHDNDVLGTSVDGILFSGHGTSNAQMTINIQNSSFHDLASGGFFTDAGGNADINVTIHNSTFQNFGSVPITIAKAGTAGAGAANITFSITNNTISGAGQNPSGVGHGININKGYASSDDSFITGTISGNTIADIEAAGGPDTDDRAVASGSSASRKAR